MRIIPFCALAGGVAISMLLGCGGGGGGSGVAPDKAVASLTQAEKISICEAQYDYFLNTIIGSAEAWCQWDAKTDATGTTDAELQSSCAVNYDLCMVNAQANFDAAKASVTCPETDPLSSAHLHHYKDCDTTVGQLEECGFEQFDIYGALRDVPCSGYTLARRAAGNTTAGAESCEAIEPSCPPPS
jgi:hypothetical protein